MRVQQHALEARQLAVELGRRPLPGAITFAAHETHSSFDGGGVEKLDPSDEGMMRIDDHPDQHQDQPEDDENGRVVDRLVLLVERGPAQAAVAESAIGSIVEPAVSDFTRAGPRLPTKNPETIRKQPSP